MNLKYFTLELKPNKSELHKLLCTIYHLAFDFSEKKTSEKIALITLTLCSAIILIKFITQ